jgi:hypothetical protein
MNSAIRNPRPVPAQPGSAIGSTYEPRLRAAEASAPAPIELGMSIGAIPLRLSFCDESLFEEARRRYAAYLCASNGGAAPVSIGPRSAAAEGADSARFQYRLHDALLTLSARAITFEDVRSIYTLDSFLRVTLSVLLAERGGLLLHAATIERGGRAFVFTGKSGAGKSTIASLAPPGSVLTDEISLLRFSGGVLYAWGTPFWGEFQAGDRACRLPVAGIFGLQQAGADRAERLPSARVPSALLANALCFFRHKTLHQRLLATVRDIALAVPVYRLHFRHDPAFWEVIDSWLKRN